MTSFFEAFDPGTRHAREQKDLDKVLVVQAKRGGTGPQPLDLDSGRIVLVRHGERVAANAPQVRRATAADLPRAGSVTVRAIGTAPTWHPPIPVSTCCAMPPDETPTRWSWWPWSATPTAGSRWWAR